MTKLTVEKMTEMLGEDANGPMVFADFMRTKAYKILEKVLETSLHGGSGLRFTYMGGFQDVFVPKTTISCRNFSAIDPRVIRSIQCTRDGFIFTIDPRA
jgi:hypothetical protein